MYPKPRKTKLAAKKNRILNEVFRSGECSRFDLARRLNINAAMAGSYVADFLESGLLVEGETSPTGRGRSPVPLRLNPQYGCFLGLDFEALRARAVLCDFAGNDLCTEEIPFRSRITRQQVLRKIVDLAGQLADRADRPLLSVGIAAPGQVDCSAGRILHYGLLPDFDDVPLLECFQQTIQAPVFVEDNIRAIAYGELLRGSGRGHQDFLCLTVRSGVGLGIVIGGRLYGGAGAFAGEVGYTVLPAGDGPQVMTDLISAKGFVQETLRLLRSRQGTAMRERLLGKANDLSLNDIVAAAEAGDELLHDRLEMLGTHLGMLTANLANLFSPEMIVLAGEVPSCCNVVRSAMEGAFRKFTLPQILEIARLDDSLLGKFAGALGVAYLGFARTYPEDELPSVGQRKHQLQPSP
ncbi:MAG: ROK family protein [Pirellulales bacterium]|nr:ROK family protein [Pirellulales bacterium]